MSICYIVGAGEECFRDFAPEPGDYVIAADGGFASLQRHGCTPDFLIGDLDSIGSHTIPDGFPAEVYPVEKDDTDTALALRNGFLKGYRIFHLYGCSGGRIDHLIANFQLMKKYSQFSASIRLVAPEYDAYVITNSSITLPARPAHTTVSIFSLTPETTGVTLQGLYYPLNNGTIHSDTPLGVSNHCCDASVRPVITAQNGTLLIIQYICPSSTETDAVLP